MSAPMFTFVFSSRRICSSSVFKFITNEIGIRNISKLSYKCNDSSFIYVKPLNRCVISQLNLNVLKIHQNNSNKILVRCMAGHSKWQNVMHVKAAKDREKSRMCDKYCRLVRYALSEGGGPDPKLNTKLADVIAEAHRHNVPNSTLESAMKAGQNAKTKSGTIEILGPGGCFIILEYESSNVSNTRHDVKQIVRKNGGAIPSGEGRWRAVYEQKGLIRVFGRTGEESLNTELALDSAIEAGAEDVQIRKDENNQPFLEFFCAPDDLHPVKKELENMQYKIEEAYVAYIPTVMVELLAQDAENADNLINELEDLSDTVRLYENVQ